MELIHTTASTKYESRWYWFLKMHIKSMLVTIVITLESYLLTFPVFLELSGYYFQNHLQSENQSQFLLWPQVLLSSLITGFIPEACLQKSNLSSKNVVSSALDPVSRVHTYLQDYNRCRWLGDTTEVSAMKEEFIAYISRESGECHVMQAAGGKRLDVIWWRKQEWGESLCQGLYWAFLGIGKPGWGKQFRIG